MANTSRGSHKRGCVSSGRLFQKRGFVITNYRIGGMTKIRLLKPNVPKIGYYGLPIRDEIELEKPLLKAPATTW